jgi:hypothetical protein
MPLNAVSIANDCLAHIGNQIGDDLPSGALSYLVNCLNQSLEEMRVKQPMMFRQTITVNFTGKSLGTINVTNGSLSCTLNTLAPSDDGCTIVINGDTTYNEIRADPNGELGAYQLLVPYGGPTGTQAATVWGDSVTLDTAFVDHAIGAVLLHDRRPIAVLNSRQDWLSAQTAWHVGDYGPTVVNSAPAVRRQPNVPEAIWLDTYLDAGTMPEYKVRVAPLPSGNWAVDLDVAIVPDEVSSDDLQPGANFYFPVPGGRVYTIFRALALYHWSGSPFFANQAARQVINQGYQDAVAQLENFRPMSGAQPRVMVRGYLN